MQNLKNIRLKNNLTRKELADLSGVNPVTIANYELGYKPINNARTSILLKLSQALGCKIIDLLDEEGLND